MQITKAMCNMKPFLLRKREEMYALKLLIVTFLFSLDGWNKISLTPFANFIKSL
jgi:hypothetical protein